MGIYKRLGAMKVKVSKTKISYVGRCYDFLVYVVKKFVKRLGFYTSRDFSSFSTKVITFFALAFLQGFPQESNSIENQEFEKLKYWNVVDNQDSFYVALKDFLRSGKYPLKLVLGNPDFLKYFSEEYFWQLFYLQWYSPYLVWNSGCLPAEFKEEYLKNVAKFSTKTRKQAELFIYYITCDFEALDKVFDEYVETYDQGGNDFSAWFLLISSYLKRGMFEHARKLLDVAVKKDKRAWFYDAIYYNLTGLPPKGLQSSDNYMLEFPEDAYIYYYRFKLFSGIKNYNEALREIERALEKMPDNPLFLLGKIEAEYLNNNFKSVLQLSESLLKKGFYKKELHFYRGNAYASRNEMQKACEEWKKSAELGNDFAETYYNYFCKKKKE